MRSASVFLAALLGLVGLVSLGAGAAAAPARQGRITYVAAGRLYVINPDGSGRRQLSTRPNVKPRCVGEQLCSNRIGWWSPSWSPDGRRLALVGSFDNGLMDGDNRVYIRESDGRTRQIFVSDVGTGGVAWSPDGKWIAHDTGRDTPELILLHPYATKAQLKGGYTAIRGGQDGAWSPDGRTLAFRYTRGYDDWNIAIFRGIARMWPDGSHFKVLAATGKAGKDPDWSPDGRRVAFAYNGICTADRAGHVIRLSRGDDSQPSWSPDGRRIVFERGDALWIIDAQGRHQHRLVAKGYSPDWSR